MIKQILKNENLILEIDINDLIPLGFDEFNEPIYQITSYRVINNYNNDVGVAVLQDGSVVHQIQVLPLLNILTVLLGVVKTNENGFRMINITTPVVNPPDPDPKPI